MSSYSSAGDDYDSDEPPELELDLVKLMDRPCQRGVQRQMHSWKKNSLAEPAMRFSLFSSNRLRQRRTLSQIPEDHAAFLAISPAHEEEH